MTEESKQRRTKAFGLLGQKCTIPLHMFSCMLVK
jgi:hypothetical protein